MIIRRRIILVFLLCAGLLIFIVIDKSSLLRSSKSLGRLVFTDFAKPNYRYTVDVFDLERGTRSSLKRESYQDVGSLRVIDGRHFYVEMCLAQNNPMFCSAYVSAVIAPRDIHRFENVKFFWKQNYGSPVWSPDATHIAFNVVNKATKNNELDRSDIYVMNADGTNVLELTPNNDISGYYFTFIWSPDSQQIAFACSDAQYLCISHVDGSHLQKLTMPPYTTVHDMDWSPDGRQIVFSLSAKDYHNAELYLVNADGSNMHRLLETAVNLHEDPVWSPDGSKIVFRSEEQQRRVGEIYVVKPDGSDLHDLSQSLDGNEFGAVWSPDSTKIAFFSNQDQKGTYLYIADADRGNPQKITDNSTWDLLDVGAPEVFWIP